MEMNKESEDFVLVLRFEAFFFFAFSLRTAALAKKRAVS